MNDVDRFDDSEYRRLSKIRKDSEYPEFPKWLWLITWGIMLASVILSTIALLRG